jgi:pSer/pThr/pTyr-binding forkhead associated (FHA) protein
MQGTVIPLGTTAITIGRAADATVVLEDDFVSNEHARLMPRGSHWIVEDLGSTNGTYVNRDRVTVPTLLEPGSALRIGRTVLEIGHE